LARLSRARLSRAAVDLAWLPGAALLTGLSISDGPLWTLPAWSALGALRSRHALWTRLRRVWPTVQHQPMRRRTALRATLLRTTLLRATLLRATLLTGETLTRQRLWRSWLAAIPRLSLLSLTGLTLTTMLAESRLAGTTLTYPALPWPALPWPALPWPALAREALARLWRTGLATGWEALSRLRILLTGEARPALLYWSALLAGEALLARRGLRAGLAKPMRPMLTGTVRTAMLTRHTLPRTTLTRPALRAWTLPRTTLSLATLSLATLAAARHLSGAVALTVRALLRVAALIPALPTGILPLRARTLPGSAGTSWASLAGAVLLRGPGRGAAVTGTALWVVLLRGIGRPAGLIRLWPLPGLLLLVGRPLAGNGGLPGGHTGPRGRWCFHPRGETPVPLVGTLVRHDPPTLARCRCFSFAPAGSQR
jgi:hypothetical protein